MRGDKTFRKKLDKKCIICKESHINTLDVHRIVEGCNDGTYELDNTITVCANCHRKIHHSKSITILGWAFSSSGRLLHCIIDDEECYIKP